MKYPKKEEITKVLDVDFKTGLIKWKYRDDLSPQWNGRNAGKVAGSLLECKSGPKYIRISINGKSHLAHRLLWIVANGDIPDGFEVDHIDMNGLNNSISNLRLASRKQNSSNKKAHRDNSSGFKGVSYFKQTGRWRARLRYEGKDINIGYFETAEMAALAYEEKQRELCKEFARV